MITFLLQLREAIRVLVNIDDAFAKANDATNKAASDVALILDELIRLEGAKVNLLVTM